MKNTKRKNMRELPVVARGMVALANGEAAQAGEGVHARNVRERELSLQVTGEPAVCGAIPLSERLLLLTDGHRVTCRGTMVSIDGAPVADAGGTIKGAHVIGGVIVVTSAAGVTYLNYHDGGWTLLDPADAVPQLSFSAAMATSSVEIAAYTFDEPYSAWRAPLHDADRNTLSAQLRSAWSSLHADIAAEGRYSAPLLVRWAVRLQDDSYLWMSAPVRLGDATLSNADRIPAVVTTRGDEFTGLEASTLTLRHYAVDIAVGSGIAAAWLPLVKSIDVLVTTEAQLLTASRALDYRCVTRTTGGREYILEMGLSRRSAAAINRELASSPWHLLSSAPAHAALTGSDFVPATEPLTLTAAQCATVGALPSLDNVVCSTSAGGRLYCCTSNGTVVVSAPGNPFVEAHRRVVQGALPIAMAVTTRPLYSSGFGRYPVYLFSDDGIYAIPQSATGVLGEARLVDRTVIATDVAPVEGGGDVWFVSRHGHLCSLSGSRVAVALRDACCTALAWCNAHDELWLLRTAGYPVVRMPSGRLSERTVDAVQLYSDARHAVAVTAAGTVLDLEREQPSVLPVAWRSHPVTVSPLLGGAVRRVVWHVSGNNTDLTLRVTAQRGIMAQDSDVSVIAVAGVVDQPLATSPMLVPARTVRLAVTGSAASGTLLLPTHLAL